MNQHVLPRPEEIEAAIGLSRAAKSKRWLLRLMLVLAICVAAAAAYYIYELRSNAASLITYDTVSPEKRDVIVTVAATGNVRPVTSVDVSSEMSGVVREVLVGENDRVTKGQVLARLDTRRLEAQRDRVLAQIASNKARQESAMATVWETRAEVTRQQTLRRRGLSTSQKLDTSLAALTRAESGVAANEAELALYQADLKIIESDIARSTITSPIDGIIMFRKVEEGQTVVSTSSAATLFTIAEDLTRIEVRVNVDEADIGQVKEGQTATFVVDAFRGEDFPASIERVSFASAVTDGVVTYSAVLSAQNADLRLRPGMSATARIVVAEHKGVWAINNDVLRYQPPRPQAATGFSITNLFLPRFPPPDRGRRTESADGKRSVQVLRDGVPVEVRFKAGANDGRFTVIMDGALKPEDKVITTQRRPG